MAKNLKNVGVLLDERTGEMGCKICGKCWHANIKPESGGKYYSKSHYCPNGCEYKIAHVGGVRLV